MKNQRNWSKINTNMARNVTRNKSYISWNQIKIWVSTRRSWRYDNNEISEKSGSLEKKSDGDLDYKKLTILKLVPSLIFGTSRRI